MLARYLPDGMPNGEPDGMQNSEPDGVLNGVQRRLAYARALLQRGKPFSFGAWGRRFLRSPGYHLHQEL